MATIEEVQNLDPRIIELNSHHAQLNTKVDTNIATVTGLKIDLGSQNHVDGEATNELTRRRMNYLDDDRYQKKKSTVRTPSKLAGIHGGT